MFDWQNGGSLLSGMNYTYIMSIVSVINLMVYIYSVYYSVKFLMKGEQENDI